MAKEMFLSNGYQNDNVLDLTLWPLTSSLGLRFHDASGFIFVCMSVIDGKYKEQHTFQRSSTLQAPEKIWTAKNN